MTRCISSCCYIRVYDEMMGQDLYPLKGFLKCPEHNKSLAAYACRSHTGELHHYYLCCKDKCKHRYWIQDVNESIEDILSTISISAQIVNLYKKTLEKLFEKDNFNRRDEIQKTRKELERLELRKSYPERTKVATREGICLDQEIGFSLPVFKIAPIA